MMNSTDVNVSDAVQQNQALNDLVEEARDLLVQEIGQASARWDTRLDSRHRELLVLRVTDAFDGEVEKEFAPDELRKSYRDHLKLRFYEINGALVRVGQWKRAVEELYSDIESWCSLSQRQPFCSREPFVAREHLSGPYTINRLIVSYGHSSIVFNPIAAWIVGGQGRVDVDGPEGATELILHEDGGWKLSTFDRRNPYVSFNQQEFERLLRYIVSD